MELVNGKKLAELLHVTGPTIWTWQKRGMPIKQRGRRGKQNLYKVADVLAWLKRTGYGGSFRIDREGGVPVEMLERHVSGKGLNPDGTEDIGLPESRAKKGRFQVAMAELKYLERVGQLVSVADVEREIGEIFRELKSAVMRIAPKISASLAAEADPARIEHMLAAAVDQAFGAVSRFLDAEAARVLPGDSPHGSDDRELG